MNSTTRIWCPRCNQGWVVRMRNGITGEFVRVCEECEALWADMQPVDSRNFRDFFDYFRSKGQDVRWKDMEE